LIGVISKENEIEVVEEFFQLFKTPWEFYKDDREYEVVIISKSECIKKINAKVILVFGYESTNFDDENNIFLTTDNAVKTLNLGEMILPIYVKIASFRNVPKNTIFLALNSEILVMKTKANNQIIIRIGYSLFEEIKYLLTEGQPVDKALISTLENHIALLRKWIVELGISLIEIPPIPAEFKYIVCLTHDVDFVKISNHFFDHSMWGFIYRCIFISFKELLTGRISLFRVLQKWQAVFLLPFIYLKIAPDFWFQFDRYLKIEKEHKATYFFIPYKKAGDKALKRAARLRAPKYNIYNLSKLLNYLIDQGNEVGVHGIDAWHSSDKGYLEQKRISEIIGKNHLGIRMHWLLYCKETFRSLEDAGYYYDSTFGYNETIGYRGGTTQVFKPIGIRNLFELPLHIQDTALFYSRRMDLSEKQALKLCKKLIDNASINGGVLTINWHQRSLGPERLWGNFYLHVLEEIQRTRPWFATARKAVDWFEQRRLVTFNECKSKNKEFRISLKSNRIGIQPPLLVRVYRPTSQNLDKSELLLNKFDYVDIAWTGENDINISI